MRPLFSSAEVVIAEGICSGIAAEVLIPILVTSFSGIVSELPQKLFKCNLRAGIFKVAGSCHG